MKDKPALMRVAHSKDGAIGVDEKMQGRAAYLCKNADCHKKAQKSKGLERSLKCPIPPEIYEQLAEHIVLL